jgi:peptide/nickel transport system substrate-binding protein
MSAVGVVAASCAQPTPQVIEKEVPVERVVKETVIVEKEVAVEKVIKETVVVEKEVVVEKVVQAEQPSKYQEAPMLAALVEQGQLPPVEDRLPEEPKVQPVYEEIGKYGGTWRRGYKGVSDRWGPEKINGDYLLEWYQPEGGGISVTPHAGLKYEQNEDATEFTWFLRKGTKWSDGEPMTTEDVRFWWEDMYMHEEIAGQTVGGDRRLMAGGEKMEIQIVDDFTFKTIFVAPNPLIPLYVAAGAGNYHGQGGPTFLAPAHYYKKLHVDYASEAEIEAALEKYGVQSWVDLFAGGGQANLSFLNADVPTATAWHTVVPPPGDLIRAERNPYYFVVDEEGNQLPYMDNVTHRFFDSAEIFSLWLMSGEIDAQNRHVNPADYTLFVENEEKGGYRTLVWRQDSTLSYRVNTAYGEDPDMREMLNDQRFVQALSVAINREEINDLVFNGIMEPRQTSPVSGSPYFKEELENYYAQYDPDLANQLLDEMGLDQRNGDGFRLRPNGETLTLILTAADVSFPSGTDVHGLTKNYWEEVGIQVHVNIVERSLYEARKDANEVQIGAWNTGNSSMIPVAPDSYTGGTMPGEFELNWFNSDGVEGIKPLEGSPFFEIWRLLREAQGEPETEKRDALFQEMIDMSVKNFIPGIGILGEPPALVIARNELRNVPNGLVMSGIMRDFGLAHPYQFFFEDA